MTVEITFQMTLAQTHFFGVTNHRILKVHSVVNKFCFWGTFFYFAFVFYICLALNNCMLSMYRRIMPLEIF